MNTFTTSDNKLSYTVTRHARTGYNVWILSELSNPDAAGNFMRGKVVADFGNTKNRENFRNAVKVAATLQTVYNASIV